MSHLKEFWTNTTSPASMPAYPKGMGKDAEM
jgi:hypothetical protein